MANTDQSETDLPKDLVSYAWKYSRRDQFILLAITVCAFPFLYFTLEIPKQIVNGAIGGSDFPVDILGFQFSQLGYLALLCGSFLLAVIASGLIKMQLNTMRGIVAERLLRRFRFQLIARMHRFPLQRFRRVGSGELTSMVTAEAEPLGGIMGDLLAQPVFQAGQMLTILTFLLIQNVWFAIAAVALIPVQAYIIPRLQRRVNNLNKERVATVRQLAERIGESAGGLADLRANNELTYALAQTSNTLHTLFDIRFRIYRIKFFMKFLNNFINQLTPFLFFAIGGYLVIMGELTLGALVAALAAFKDLTAPWKELLAFYNRFQDMSVRYVTVTEQFSAPGMLPASAIDAPPDTHVHLTGPIKVDGVTVLSDSESVILDALTFEIPQGAMAAIACRDPVARATLLHTLSRQILPNSGTINVGEIDLADLHNETVGRRIGVVTEQPFLFKGTVGRNIAAALHAPPNDVSALSEHNRVRANEALRVGNTPYPVDVPWFDPAIIGMSNSAEVRDWWMQITAAMGTDDWLLRRALDEPVTGTGHDKLRKAVVELRPVMAEKLSAERLDRRVRGFDPAQYHPDLAVAENLLFAIPQRPTRAAAMAADAQFLPTLQDLGIAEELRRAARDMMRVLMRTFGEVGTAHPLFQRLPIEADVFETLAAALKRAGPNQTLSQLEDALLLTVPFKLTAGDFPQAVPNELRRRILRIRSAQVDDLRNRAGSLFVSLDPQAYAPGLTLLENLVYGKLSASEADRARIREIAAETLEAAGMKTDASATIVDLETNVGGTILPPVARERIAFVRSVIKRPDILILDRFLASHDDTDRVRTRDRLRELLPDATIILLEPEFTEPQAYDCVLEIVDGRLAGQTTSASTVIGGEAARDLDRKVLALRTCALFQDLPLAQVRLLAFASEWLDFEAGAYVFRSGDATDGAYLLTKGQAELRWPDTYADDEALLDVLPGRIVGDLSVIMRSRRTVDMVALTAIETLRIRRAEFWDIIRADAGVATRLLETVSGYLIEAAQERHETIESYEQRIAELEQRVATKQVD